MIKYSIIIPTHNRQYLLKRNIEYYSNFQNFQIYICDSSVEAYKTHEIPKHITYIHMPNKSFVEKMYLQLNKIETKYVSVCADDDFIMEHTTKEMILHMSKNNYVMSIGKYLGFDIPFNGFYEIYTDRKVPKSYRDPEKMLKSYLSNYYMSLWATYEAKTIIKAYKILSKSKFSNDNLIEIVIAINCSLSGEIYFYNKVYGIREVNNSNSKNWAKKHPSLLKSYIKFNLIEDLKSLEKEFFREYNNNLFQKGIFYYIKDTFLKKIVAILRKKTERRYIYEQNNKDLKEIIRIMHVNHE